MTLVKFVPTENVEGCREIRIGDAGKEISGFGKVTQTSVEKKSSNPFSKSKRKANSKLNTFHSLPPNITLPLLSSFTNAVFIKTNNRESDRFTDMLEIRKSDYFPLFIFIPSFCFYSFIFPFFIF